MGNEYSVPGLNPRSKPSRNVPHVISAPVGKSNSCVCSIPNCDVMIFTRPLAMVPRVVDVITDMSVSDAKLIGTPARVSTDS